MSLSAGEVTVGFRGDSKQVDTAISNIEKRLNDLERRGEQAQQRFAGLASASRQAGLAFAGLTAAVGLVGKSIVDTAGKFELYKVQFEVLAGSAENGQKLMKQLSDFALKTPFTITGLRDTAVQLMAYGIAAENVIPVSKKLGDLSAGNQARFEQLAYAYGQVGAAGRLYATEVRQFSNAGVNALQALADYYGITREEANTLVRDGVVTFEDFDQALTKFAGRVDGLMEKGAQTVPGILSNIGDAITRFKEQFAETEAWEKFKEGLMSVLEFVQNSLPAAFERIQGFMDFLAQHMEVVKIAVIALAGAITAALIPGLISLVSFIPALLPVAAAGAAIALAAYGIYKAWQTNFLGIREVVGAAWTWIQGAFQKAYTFIVNTTRVFMETIRAFWEAFGTPIMTTLEVVWNIVRAVVDMIYTFFVARFMAIATAVWGILKGLVKIVAGFIQVFSGIFSGNADVIKRGALLMWNGLKDALIGVVDGVITIVEGMINTVIAGLNGFIRVANQIPGVEIGELGKVTLPKINAGKSDNLGVPGEVKMPDGLPEVKDMLDNITDSATTAYDAIHGKPPGGGGQGGGKSEAQKELEKQQKLLEDITESARRVDAARLRVLRDQLEIKEKSNALTEKEARILERLKDSSDQAFDLSNAKDWNEFMDALGDSAEDLADQYDDVTDAVAKIREELDDLQNDALDKVKEAGLKIGEIKAEFEKAFGSIGGPIGGEQAKDVAKDLAQEYVKAKEAVADYRAEVEKGGSVSKEKGDKYIEAMKVIERVEAIMNGNSGTEGLGNALKEALQSAVQIASIENPIDRVLAEAEEKKKAEEAAMQEEVKHQQTIIDMNEAFRKGELQAWIDQNQGVITERELLEAQELANKEQRLKDELAKNLEVQTQISNALGVEAAVRDQVMKDFHTKEIARLEEMKRKAVEAVNAIRAAQQAASSVGGGGGPGFASGGFTGSGSSSQVAGFVHKNEYVIPAHMVKALAPTGMIGMLERMRRGIGGFMQGGLVGSSMSKTYAPNISIHASDKLDLRAFAQGLLMDMKNA